MVCTRKLGLSIALILLTACSDHSSTPSGVALNNGTHWLLINYWAEWCKPCLTEIPELNDFAERHANQALVYAVNYDGISGEQLESQVEKIGIRFQVLESDPGPTLGYERTQVLPATVVLTPTGEIQQVLYGPQTVESLELALGLTQAKLAEEQ